MLRLTIKSTPIAQEFLPEKMIELGAEGIQIIDPEDMKTLPASLWDYKEDTADTLDSVVCIIGHFENGEGIAEAINEYITELKTYGITIDIQDMLSEQVISHDYLAEWKKHFKPLTAGKFRIEYVGIEDVSQAEKANLLVVKLHAGTAFGTGQHETTFMCLEHMSKLNFENKTVLDIGCGSGILGISATVAGAKFVGFLDNDPQAVSACKENLQLNSADKNTHIMNMQEEWQKADVILANITADVLKSFAPKFKQALKNNGALICSGIINSRAQEVINHFKNHGLLLVKSKQMGEWTSCKFTVSL